MISIPIKTSFSISILVFAYTSFINQAAGQAKKVNGVKVTAVFDEHTHKSYYLLKDGRKFGWDSLYVWDNSYDNLQENKIRFRDPKSDKVGFFNEYGKIVIPALYNDAHPFINGYALVVHNGKRMCLDGTAFNKNSPCEDWLWQGATAIIDIHNKIIADNIQFSKTDDIDWYSLKFTKSVPDTSLYTSFKTPDRNYCTFLDFKKEFEKWFFKTYLDDLSIRALFASCYKEIFVEDKSIEFYKNPKPLRTRYSTATFVKQYQATLVTNMNAIKSGKIKAEVFDNMINPYYYTGKNFNIFYNSDGEPNKQMYPVFEVVCTYYKGKILDYQQQFSFIRTNNGYKLVEVGLHI